MKTREEIKAEIHRLHVLESSYRNAHTDSKFGREDNMEQAMRANVASRKLEWVLSR